MTVYNSFSIYVSRRMQYSQDIPHGTERYEWHLICWKFVPLARFHYWLPLKEDHTKHNTQMGKNQTYIRTLLQTNRSGEWLWYCRETESSKKKNYCFRSVVGILLFVRHITLSQHIKIIGPMDGWILLCMQKHAIRRLLKLLTHLLIQIEQYN